jgi:hypothetical protein
MGSETATGVGDDDGGTASGVEAEGGVGNGVGAKGSGMVRQGRGRRRGSGMMTRALPVASRLKVGSATGLARRGQGWCDGVGDDDWGTVGAVEVEGGVGNGVGAMARRRGRRRRRGWETWAA